MTTKRGKVKKEVTLWKDDVEWYNDHYKDMPLSSALAHMLSSFRSLHRDASPKQLGIQAAQNLKGLLETNG